MSPTPPQPTSVVVHQLAATIALLTKSPKLHRRIKRTSVASNVHTLAHPNVHERQSVISWSFALDSHDDQVHTQLLSATEQCGRHAPASRFTSYTGLPLERYRNIAGDSGVSEFECGSGFVRVSFGRGPTYLYTDSSAGSHHILEMQRLARSGDGLNAYINRYVRSLYESKS